MGRKFHHLTYPDRLKIEALHMAKHTSQEIADQLGVHVSTINRELKLGVYTHLNTDWTEDLYIYYNLCNFSKFYIRRAL